MLEKKYSNQDMNIELTSYIDNKQNVWFRGKDIALILGYKNENTNQILKNHVSEKHKVKRGVTNSDPLAEAVFISEPGFYELVFKSKLPITEKFWDWVFSVVLPSIRKYGQYKLFDNPHNHMIVIGNETDLHHKVVDLIRKLYPDSILVAGLGENQDTEDTRPDSYKKGYMRGQPDLMVLNYHKDFKGLCIELKGLTNYYYVSVAQKEMKKWYVENGYAFILSNNYDKISKAIHEYMRGIRVPCKYCVKSSSLRKLEIRTIG